MAYPANKAVGYSSNCPVADLNTSDCYLWNQSARQIETNDKFKCRLKGALRDDFASTQVAIRNWSSGPFEASVHPLQQALPRSPNVITQSVFPVRRTFPNCTMMAHPVRKQHAQRVKKLQENIPKRHCIHKLPPITTPR